MKKKKFNPFKNLVLDKYEQKIEDAFDRGEYVPVDEADANRIFQEAVKGHSELEESKSITLRIKKKDLVRLKARAARNNIPYQTLINLLINSYTSGRTKLSL